jgi:hypothetical protein
MSQHDYNLANAAGSAFRSDANSVLLAIASLNSGATAPSTTFANMLWYDTANNLLKMRNEADNAWVTLLEIDQSNDILRLAGMDYIEIPEKSGDPSTPTNAVRLYCKDDGGDSELYVIDAGGNVVQIIKDGALNLTQSVGIGFVIDGGGAAITTGVKGYLEVPFACTITACRLLADQSGAIKVDIWKDAYANYPPTDADTITAANEPEIAASGVKDEDTVLTGWTTAISAGDILGFNVDSCTTIERCTVSLTVTR